MGLFKLIPAATLVYGGMANQDVIKTQMDKILGLATTTAVQTEVDDISKMIYLDTFDGSNPKNQQEFIDYVRKNMRNKVGRTRDTSQDFWGTEYRYEKTPAQIKVVSAGPDKEFGTGDDILSGYSL